MQLLTHHFWSNWLKEYLPTLTRRVKWQSDYPNVKIDELILLQNHTVRRGLWSFGRIEHIYPGRDGIVQFFDVQTKTGVYRTVYRTKERLMRFLEGGGMLPKETKNMEVEDETDYYRNMWVKNGGAK